MRGYFRVNYCWNNFNNHHYGLNKESFLSKGLGSINRTHSVKNNERVAKHRLSVRPDTTASQKTPAEPGSDGSNIVKQFSNWNERILFIQNRVNRSPRSTGNCDFKKKILVEKQFATIHTYRVDVYQIKII